MRTWTLAFLAGSVLALTLPPPPPLAGHWLLGATVLVAVRWRTARLPAFALAGCLWTGLAAVSAAGAAIGPALEGRDVLVRGRVEDIPVARGARTRLRVRIDAVEDPGGAASLEGALVRLSWYGAEVRPRAGERWRLRLRLRRPRGLANPGGFDFETYAMARGLAAVGYVRADGANAMLERAPWWSLAGARHTLAERLDAAGEPGAARAIVKALGLGVRDDLSRGQWRVLRETGTAHLVAISGLHVGLVAWLAAGAGRRLWSRSAWLSLRLPAPSAGLACALVAAAGYAALAGFSVPTRRALTMLGVLVLVRLAGRSVATSSVLALACLAVLLGDPLAVASAGFWLSFCAVAAIAFGTAARLAPRRGDAGDAGVTTGLWWRWGRVHPVVALGVAPAGLVLLGQSAALAPLANALAVPWVSMLVVPPALGATVLAGVWPAGAAALMALASAALDLLWPTLELIAALSPPAAVARPGALAVALAVGGFVLAVLPGPARLRWLGVCLLAPLFLARAPPIGPGTVEIVVLDVGQGLAVVVRGAGGVLVYDTGPGWPGGFDAGRDVVARHLLSAGLGRVERLVVSHADNDHAGGARGLRASMAVGEVVGDPSSTGWPATPCTHGRAWREGPIRFTLLRVDGSGSENDRSCVLRIDTPAGTVLLPGDVESAAERELLAHLADAAPLAVLVAPHHGSATSSTSAFIEALRPGHVAISAGYRNRFGFPHPAVLARLERVGASIRSTGACGAITYRLSPGEPVAVSCWRDRRRGPFAAPAATPNGASP